MLKLPQLPPETLGALSAAKTRWLDPSARVLRKVVPLLLLVYLAYAFTQLGWGRIWSSRPAFWLFYVSLIPGAFLQPISDWLIYRNLWGADNAPLLTILLRKQFLNSYLFEYAGEGYFLLWARNNLSLTNSSLVHAVKDTNVLSAGAALTIIWIVVAALAAIGGAGIGQFVSNHFLAFSLVAAIPLLLSLGLVIGGQRVTVLSRRQMVETFSIHFVRCVIAFAIELTSWWLSAALPSLAACFSFVALRLFVSRLPLVPRKDLLFISVALATIGMLKLSAAPIAAVFAIQLAADQTINILIVGIPWLLERRTTDDNDLHRKQLKSASEGENAIGPRPQPARTAET